MGAVDKKKIILVRPRCEIIIISARIEEELIDVTPATSPKAKGLLSIDPCLSSHASVLMMKKLPDVEAGGEVAHLRRVARAGGQPRGRGDHARRAVHAAAHPAPDAALRGLAAEPAAQGGGGGRAGGLTALGGGAAPKEDM